MTHTFNSKELDEANIKLKEAFKNPTKLFIENDTRWNEYIAKITKPNDKEYNIRNRWGER